MKSLPISPVPQPMSSSVAAAAPAPLGHRGQYLIERERC
jgi:hypothetical protein